MNICCIKCPMFTENRNVKINREIDSKVSLYLCLIDCGFKTFETINEEELNYLFKGLI